MPSGAWPSITTRGRAAERVFLEVRPSNTGAIALYHDEGFNEIGRRPRYYPAKDGREDAIVMAMELLAPTGHWPSLRSAPVPATRSQAFS